MRTAPAGSVSTTTAHLVALDIDGTLVHGDNKVPPETVRALELVRASGHYVVLATGRSLVGLTSIARRLGLAQGWAVSSNGALTARLDPTAPSGYEVIATRTFTPEPVIRHATRLSPHLHLAVEDVGRGWRVNRRFAPDLLNGPQKLAPLEELLAGQASRVVLHAERIIDHTDTLRRFGATVTPAGSDWIDVTAPDTSKATALEHIRCVLGVDRAHTIAVGDGVNDIPMLTWAMRGVAMGHAADTVREAADEVTNPITDHGAIPALLSLVPALARRPGLSPLGAQLAAAFHTAAQAPGPVVVRVWHGSGRDLAGCEIHVLRSDTWLRMAQVPAGKGATMRDVERAAHEAGLAYPRGREGRRRAHWRTAVRGHLLDPAEFELPLTRASGCPRPREAPMTGRPTAETIHAHLNP